MLHWKEAQQLLWQEEPVETQVSEAVLHPLEAAVPVVALSAPRVVPVVLVSVTHAPTGHPLSERQSEIAAPVALPSSAGGPTSKIAAAAWDALYPCLRSM